MRFWGSGFGVKGQGFRVWGMGCRNFGKDVLVGVCFLELLFLPRGKHPEREEVCLVFLRVRLQELQQENPEPYIARST